MSKETLTTISLGLGERLILQRMLSDQQGNLMTMTVIKKFVEDLSLTEAELDSPLIRSTPGQITVLGGARDFLFTSWRLQKIRDMLKAASESKQVRLDQLSLYDKFLPPAEAESGDEALAAEWASMTREAEEAEEAGAGPDDDKKSEDGAERVIQ